MSRIDEIDKRMAIEMPQEDGVVFRNCLEAPFRIYGVMATEDGFVRMPERVAEHVNANIPYLNRQTAGGRVRFVTDSRVVHIRAWMRNVDHVPHFPMTGSAGFDLYADGHHRGTFRPPFQLEDFFASQMEFHADSVYDTGEGQMREITIHFPLYAGVVRLEIGLAEGATLSPAPLYHIMKPVVFYGSSITQGGCASRPGNSYQAILTRTKQFDHINLGFSGSARGEEAIAKYISSLDMSAFVLDYSYNAPNTAHLAATHEPLFLAVRGAHPDLPIIMVSAPQADVSHEMARQREVIERTYRHAVEAGDKNVYIVDGGKMFDPFGGSDTCTVDTCHPNDLGFFAMAKAIGEPLCAALGI